MKKITFLFIMTLICAQFKAQEKKENTKSQDIGKNYELKINAFSLITFSALDLSFERLINEDSSYGVAVFYNFSDYEDDDDIAFPKKFSITPYYRWFFSENQYARGFFIEGFGMLNTYQDIFYSRDSYQNSNKVGTQTGFALGISVGGKFITKEGFTAEVLLGVGRNLIKEKIDNDYNFFDYNILGRFGISLGYRF
jgi:hypothetical protein